MSEKSDPSLMETHVFLIFIGDSLLPAMCVNSITEKNRNHHYSHKLNLNEASLEIAIEKVDSDYREVLANLILKMFSR